MKRRMRKSFSGFRVEMQRFAMMIIFIVCFATALGFFGTKNVIVPYLLTNESDKTGKQTQEINPPSQTKSDKKENTVEPIVTPQALVLSDSAISKVESSVPTVKAMGFAIQFGSFSTKGAAEVRVKELAQQSIFSEIVEKDSTYKVVSKTYPTKTEAASDGDLLREKTGDVYIIAI